MYILDGKTPVPCESLEGRTDADFFAQVALTGGPWGSVSTVFIGIDLSHGRGPAPLLFETLASDGEQDRYATWEEAEAGHARHVARMHRLQRLAARHAADERIASDDDEEPRR